MSGNVMYPMRKSRILSWITQEFEEIIPCLDPNGRDRQLLYFAYKDLKTYLEVRWKVTSLNAHNTMITTAVKNDPNEMKSFLKIWVFKWLEMWRKRVTFFEKMPEYSAMQLESLRKARKRYHGLKKRDELQSLVVHKLIKQGEVCMSEFIAKNLIVGEIAKHLISNSGKVSKEVELNLIAILQKLKFRVEALADRKAPFIYLKILKSLTVESM